MCAALYSLSHQRTKKNFYFFPVVTQKAIKIYLSEKFPWAVERKTKEKSLFFAASFFCWWLIVVCFLKSRTCYFWSLATSSNTRIEMMKNCFLRNKARGRREICNRHVSLFLFWFLEIVTSHERTCYTCTTWQKHLQVSTDLYLVRFSLEKRKQKHKKAIHLCRRGMKDMLHHSDEK